MEIGLTYRDSNVDENIVRAVEQMGFEGMTPIQEKAIPILLEGKDIIGQAQTGTGKTAAFGIPMIQNVDENIKKPQGIVLCPTRELAMQAAEEIRKLAKYMHGVKVIAIYGGQDISKQIRALSQGVQIIVGTPGRVMDHMRRRTIKTSEIRMIVLDEADEMLNMGFREDIETILEGMPNEHQMALFSATMPKAILDITKTYQKEDAVFIKITQQEVTVPLIKQAYYRVARKDKIESVCSLMAYYQPKKSLIFCNTKKMVDEMAENLKGRGFQAEGLHGDLSQFQRDTVMNLFRNARCEILIATDVAARGIDVSGVDAVFNFDVPDDIEYYVHRIGRTGRAGKTGRSFTLVSGREINKIRDIERLCHTEIKERKIPSPKDIVKVKSGTTIAEAVEVMQNKDLSAIKKSIEHAAVEFEFTTLDLAAAFMQMKMGDEPEEILEEKGLFDKKKTGGNRRGFDNRDYKSRGGNRDRSGDRGGNRERSASSGSSGGNRDKFGGKTEGSREKSSGSYAGKRNDRDKKYGDSKKPNKNFDKPIKKYL